MNKLFTKIAALALGATMAVGVGVAVASKAEAKPVSAATDDVYELVTAANQISDGDTVIFVNQAETYASSTTQNNNNRGMVAITEVSNHQYTIKNTEAVQEYAVVEGATSGQFGFHTGTGFLNATGGTSNNYLTSAACDATTANVTGTRAWTLSASNNVFTVLNSSKNNNGTYYYLAFNGTTIFSAYRSGQSKPFIYRKLAAQTVSSSSGEFEVEVGNTITLSSSATTTVTWSSDNSSIASVDSSTGVVTGVAGGSTTITATASGYAPKSVTVTVTSSTPYVSLDKSTYANYWGETTTLTATYGNLGGTLSWKTSDSSVVSLSSNTGATITISLRKTGTATVTAYDSANESTYFDSCVVTVNNVPTAVDVTRASFTEISGNSYDEFSHTYSGLNDLNYGKTGSVTIVTYAFPNANGIQAGKGKGCYIYNSTSVPGRITSVTVTFTASGNNVTSMYADKDSTATTSSTKIGDGSSSVTEQEFDFSGYNFNYFYLDLSGVTGACYYSLTIEYGNLLPEVTLDPTEAEIFTTGTTSVAVDVSYSNFSSVELVTATSSDKSVIPDANCVLSNNGETLTITSNGVAGSSTITVEAMDEDEEVYSATIDITVTDNSKALSSIAVTTNPTKTEYVEGNTLDLTGMVVTAYFTNSTSEVVTASVTTDPDTTTPLTTSDDTVTVSYTYAGVTKTDTFSIEVVAATVSSMNWTGTTASHFQGIAGVTQLTSTIVDSWTVKANWTNGTQETLTFSDYVLKVGTTTISSLPYTWQAADDGKALSITYESYVKTNDTAVASIIENLHAIEKVVEVEGTATWTATSGALGSTSENKTGTITTTDENSNSYTWNYERTGNTSTYVGFTSSCIQLGSGSGYENLEIRTSNIPGTIESVYVECSSGNNVHNLSITVDGDSYYDAAAPKWTTVSSVGGTGSSSGEIIISLVDSSSTNKALYIKSISVTYSGTDTTNYANKEYITQKAVVDYAKSFNSTLAEICEAYGTTDPEDLEEAWTTLFGTFGDTFVDSEKSPLTSDQRTLAINMFVNAKYIQRDSASNDSLQAMLGKYDEILSHYDFDDFLSDAGRSPAPQQTKITILPTTENSSLIAIVVIVSVISLTAIGGYIFLRRRKEQ